ncbi:MAG TPA: hypothetical protein VHV83_09450 [Armatimonadota bacterium]|nr:hypothetical protein [Armatimonadota bacterium]
MSLFTAIIPYQFQPFVLVSGIYIDGGQKFRGNLIENDVTSTTDLLDHGLVVL